MRGWLTVKGQARAVGNLQAAVESGKIAHAYLFTGPKGTGKVLAAQIFARALNCNAGSGRPCDNCLSCQKALHNNHPDISVLKPEGLSLKIEQVRALQKNAHAVAYEGKNKVFILEDIHKATIQASNSLLKILEEPPENTVFILISENLKAIPATVISRCQRVTFGPIEKEIIENTLIEHGVPSEKSRTLAGLAYGSIGKAFDLLENDELLTARQRAVEFLLGSLDGNYFKVFKIIESLEKEKVNIGLMLDQFLSLLRDIYLWETTRSPKLVSDSDSVIDLYELIVGRLDLEQAVQTISQFAEFHRKQANNKLLLDVLSLRLAKLGGTKI